MIGYGSLEIVNFMNNYITLTLNELNTFYKSL